MADESTTPLPELQRSGLDHLYGIGVGTFFAIATTPAVQSTLTHIFTNKAAAIGGLILGIGGGLGAYGTSSFGSAYFFDRFKPS